MNVLVIGGHKHGEWLELPDGAGAWVDLTTAMTHRIRNLAWGVTRITPEGAQLTGENFDVKLAVHPDITVGGAQQEQAIVTQMIQMMAMNEFIRAHGTPKVTEQDKAPDSPAALFGPDGKPL